MPFFFSFFFPAFPETVADLEAAFVPALAADLETVLVPALAADLEAVLAPDPLFPPTIWADSS